MANWVCFVIFLGSQFSFFLCLFLADRALRRFSIAFKCTKALICLFAAGIFYGSPLTGRRGDDYHWFCSENAMPSIQAEQAPDSSYIYTAIIMWAGNELAGVCREIVICRPMVLVG